MGVKIILFLLFMTALTYAIKRKVWADCTEGRRRSPRSTESVVIEPVIGIVGGSGL